MRTEAVANSDLLRRWEMLTDVADRSTVAGREQPLTPVDPALAGFDPLVGQLHRHAHRSGAEAVAESPGRAAITRS